MVFQVLPINYDIKAFIGSGDSLASFHFQWNRIKQSYWKSPLGNMVLWSKGPQFDLERKERLIWGWLWKAKRKGERRCPPWGNLTSHRWMVPEVALLPRGSQLAHWDPLEEGEYLTMAFPSSLRYHQILGAPSISGIRRSMKSVRCCS